MTRIVTRGQAEEAFCNELFGDPFRFDGFEGVIVEIRLPERPTLGGSQGRGFLPLTYVVRAPDGRTERIATGEGPEVDEARAFLYATLPHRQVGERLELWFEGEEVDLAGNVSCCC